MTFFDFLKTRPYVFNMSQIVKKNFWNFFYKIWGYLFNMEKGFEKLLKNLLLEKYPIFLDVRIEHTYNIMNRSCNEIVLLVGSDYEKKIRDISNGEVIKFIDDFEDYIKNLGKYMSIIICGIYVEVIDEK